MPTALIADDEPLLRERLQQLLARLWPGLQVVAQARNGREAVAMFEAERPDIAFLDVHMPGLNGVEAARAIGRRAQLVFITAYEQYALQAFEEGALDYLVKPLDEDRLADTVQRLQQRLQSRPSTPSAPSEWLTPDMDTVLNHLAAALQQRGGAAPAARAHLQWIKASVGQSVRLVAVDDVVFLRSDDKYTLVAWAGGEALIRKTIRELTAELDPSSFVQVHRSCIVNLRHVARVVRAGNETADVHLRGRAEVLPVSRNHLHHFRQM